MRKIDGEMKIGSIKSIFYKRYSNFLNLHFQMQAHYNIAIKTVIIADLIINRERESAKC